MLPQCSTLVSMEVPLLAGKRELNEVALADVVEPSTITCSHKVKKREAR